MKKVAFLILMISLNVHATGGFHCYNNQKNVVIHGTTGRVFGNPLVDLSLTVDNMTTSIALDLIVDYWNLDEQLKIAAIDKDFIQPILVLRTKKKIFSRDYYGSVELSDRTVSIRCEVD